MSSHDTAVRKRAQIAKTNRMMFIWIAAASAIVGVAAVASIFLVQQLIYNEKVLSKKQDTISTLENNLEAVDGLKQEILKLDANSALLSARANDDQQAVRVILDALPSDANSLALGASLQARLLNGIDGLTVESIQVEPVQGVEALNSGSGEATVTDDGFYAIEFSSMVSGGQEALKTALTNLERSIRTIEVTSVRIEGQSGNSQDMLVNGRAFYEPAVELGFSEEPVE